VVITELFCDSTKFQSIKPVTYTIERYIEDFPEETSIVLDEAVAEIESQLVGFDFSNPLMCQIGKIKLEASDNVIFDEKTKSVELLVSSGGFRETLLLTYRDTMGYILENTLEISLCGPTFWVIPWCLRPLPIVEVDEDSLIPEIIVNDPPVFTIDIQDKVYLLDDLSETYLGFFTAINEEPDPEVGVETETEPEEETIEQPITEKAPEIDRALFLIEYPLSEIRDTEDDDYEVKFEVEPEFSTIITLDQDTGLYKFSIDMLAFYNTGSTVNSEV
jgi:hypothetical protein